MAARTPPGRSNSSREIVALVALIVFACARVISTYDVFGHTWDEPEHLAAGISLIDRGDYPYDAQHPPLARLAMAIGPYLAGARSHGNAGPSGEEEGRDILYDGGHYDKYLTLARVGMLPFLAVLLIATWLWARRVFDTSTALLATAIVVATPTVIGHAAVAALDLPMVGTCMLALYFLLRWFDSMTSVNALAFGIASGLAAATKLSSIPFVGIVAIVWTLTWFFQQRSTPKSEGRGLAAPVGHLLLAAAAAAATLLLVYRFSVAGVLESFSALIEHNSEGHLSYFWGELRRTGWWNFYLVALAIKTPLPLLIGALVGSAWLGRCAFRTRNWALASAPLAAVSIFLFASAYSHINIGVRHVLLVYPLMAITAAALCMRLWRTGKIAWRAMIVALSAWLVGGAALAHPDNLAYFNELAGSHPETYLIDSDLDWGQDLKRLKLELVKRNIDRISIVYRGSADLAREQMPVPFSALWPKDRASGWIAVFLLAKATDESHGYDWLNAYTPVARIGKSIDLYYIPTER